LKVDVDEFQKQDDFTKRKMLLDITYRAFISLADDQLRKHIMSPVATRCNTIFASVKAAYWINCTRVRRKRRYHEIPQLTSTKK
jgi:hypothetical protein